ncbi:uncharacterized protein SAPINGB_P004855 [Magnusiomyces paraingens]|uniref:Uncharacterized protein n=1 Tax=Magnusiomyces paraingens TaxID=2606893 RepID=A0A5E8BXG5_9ASCO|nr:uncharacterized protein SAPINGB_P004855 [Saprochaete ingens]VVT56144.1 unnamed protein product [Saprochaete ingens]
MQFFSGSSKTPGSGASQSATTAAAATAAQPTLQPSAAASAAPSSIQQQQQQQQHPTSSSSTSHPSFFSSTFGGFFNPRSPSTDSTHSNIQSDLNNTPYNQPASYTGTSASTASRRARSLSRPRYSNIAPPITADEAMNLSRAISRVDSSTTDRTHSPATSENEYRASSVSRPGSTAGVNGPSSYASNNPHHNYGRYDGGTLSRVVSAEPDFAAPTHQDVSHLAAGIPAFPSYSSIQQQSSTASNIPNDASNSISSSGLAQRLEQLQTSGGGFAGSDKSAATPMSPTTPYRPHHRLRRNSGSGARYQGIGLVAAYDQTTL